MLTSMINMTIILGVLLVCLTSASAIEFPDSDYDRITDDSISFLTTTVSLVPGKEITLDEEPDQVTNGDVVHDFEVTVDAKKLTESYPPLEIPENHKNYSSPFASSIELPPLLNQFNAYQQQYKDYYNQKAEYKPVKFETNAASNHYVSQGLSSYLEDDVRHRYEESKYERQPFPYTYENERLPLLQQSLWAEHGEAHPVQNEVSVHYYQPYESKPEGGLTPKEKGLYGWKKALKFFTALVPLGLLLATLTPSVISINSTVDSKPTRQRSLNEMNLMEDEFREFFKSEHGSKVTDETDCDKKLICELSRLGRMDNGTYMQKSFWSLANKIPNEVAEELGTRELFQAIRVGNCESYKCPKKEEEVTTTKRVTKRRRKKVAEARAIANTSHYTENHDLHNR